MMRLYIYLSVIWTTACVQAENQFHLLLSPEDRHHYFGTDDLLNVPRYGFTSPRIVEGQNTTAADGSVELHYNMTVFGETFHMRLSPSKHIISPACIVQHFTANGTRAVYPCNMQDAGCYYEGKTNDDEDSWITAHVCSGMTALVSLPTRNIVVQPVRQEHVSRTRRDTDARDVHLVYEYSPQYRFYSEGSPLNTDERDSDTSVSRRKRGDNVDRYVETTLVVDPSSYRLHGHETETMTKTILNVVAQRYSDPSLRQTLYFTLNKVMILEHDQDNLKIDTDASKTLDNFCAWQTTWNPKDDSNPEHSDFVALLTRVDLELHGQKATAGLARKGMCGERTKCAVVEENGLASGLVLAHETGHVLGMNHDSEGNNCENGKHMMSSWSASGPESLKWSSCSAQTLDAFLSSDDSKCLHDVPPASSTRAALGAVKPGTLYSANHQCKLMLGPEAEVCDTVVAQGMRDVCGSIVCRPQPNTDVKGCRIYSAVRMDGTECGPRKWCIEGKCVDMSAGSPEPVNGGWSDWEANFGQCSRSCGGGVKIKRRFCNNPEPMYGGSNCTGEGVAAVLCNVHECDTSQTEFLAQQCAATDSRPIQGKTYHWVPNTGALGDDSCTRSCKAQGTNIMDKRGLNVDGSECVSDADAIYTKCVSGACKTFGCDGHMGSVHVYDQCGVCNGQGNTCRKLTGTFKGGKPHEFTTFVRMPKGSTGITITQGNKYCHLSVSVSGEQLFGESAQRQSGTFVIGGVTVKYNKVPERLHIVGPVSAPVTAQVYRQYGPPYVGVDPDVNYEYHVHVGDQSPSLYTWKSSYGVCSKSCGRGSRLPVVRCEGGRGPVADFHCKLREKPDESPQPCNSQACPPRWRTSQWSQCSRSCGDGQKHRTVDCVLENNGVETVLSAARCAGIPKPGASGSCNNGACPGVWRTEAWSQCSESCARGVKLRNVKCYANANSNSPVADSHCIAGDKPAEKEYCVLKPCRTDITGSDCKDKVENCFGSYGRDVCTGSYKGWARNNCMKSCGVCQSTPTSGHCEDTSTSCNKYAEGFCTDPSYMGWAKQHCQKFCGYCTECVDSADNCAAYGKSMCTAYQPWASKHCQKFCGFCHTRRKRDTTSLVSPPLGSECVEQLISETGELTPVTDHGSEPLTGPCSIHVTGPPGTTVHIAFDVFNMAAKDCLEVHDVALNRSDIFCGELFPFVWESRGPTVRLTYSGTETFGTFHAAYSIRQAE